MFHEFISDKLADRDDTKAWLTDTLKISAAGMEVQNLKGKKVKMEQEYPPAVKAVIDWIE